MPDNDQSPVAFSKPVMNTHAAELADSISAAVGYGIEWQQIFDILFSLIKLFGVCAMLAPRLAYSRMKKSNRLRSERIKEECCRVFGDDEKVNKYATAAIEDLCDSLSFADFKAMLDESKT